MLQNAEWIEQCITTRFAYACWPDHVVVATTLSFSPVRVGWQDIVSAWMMRVEIVSIDPGTSYVSWTTWNPRLSMSADLCLTRF